MKIIVFKNDEIVLEKVFDGESVSLGRASDNDIVLEAPHISRHQVTITFKNGEFLVENRSSVKKLIFEGKGFETLKLKSKESFKISPYEIQLIQKDVITHPLERNDSREESQETLPVGFNDAGSEHTHISETSLMGVLEPVFGSPVSKKQELRSQDVFTIGRASSNILHIEDPQLSRHHAQIVFEHGKFYIEDLVSENGTLVNGTRITKHELHTGDVIKLGDAEFQFKMIDKRFYGVPAPSHYLPPQPYEMVGLRKPQKKSRKVALTALFSLLVLCILYLFLGPEKKEQGPQPASEIHSQGVKFENLAHEEKTKITESITEALRLMNEGDFLGAINILEKIRARVPAYEKSNALLAQAKKFYQERRVEESKQKENLTQALLQAKEGISFEVSTAIQNYRRRQFQEALESIDKALEQDPQGEIAPQEIAQAKELKKIILQEQSRKEEIKNQKEELKKQEAQIKSYMNRGSVRYAQGDYVKAIAYWQKVTNYKEPSFKKYVSQAEKNIKESASHILGSFIMMTQSLDQEFETLFPRGRALAEAPTVDQLSELRRKYVDVHEKVPEVTADLRLQKRKIEEKLEILNKELNAHAQNQYYQSLLFQSQGNMGEAVRVWKEIVTRYDIKSEYVKKAEEKLRKYGK
ncbi:MAG: FHA domain-containing protein [Deltaproteobacteria bacterium]|nr:FHA domain-containing protein [Deltaproteobacteria bacterium]